jgi:hypothetical protein
MEASAVYQFSLVWQDSHRIGKFDLLPYDIRSQGPFDGLVLQLVRSRRKLVFILFAGDCQQRQRCQEETADILSSVLHLIVFRMNDHYLD